MTDNYVQSESFLKLSQSVSLLFLLTSSIVASGTIEQWPSHQSQVLELGQVCSPEETLNLNLP
jgi:hypothetical protein